MAIDLVCDDEESWFLEMRSRSNRVPKIISADCLLSESDSKLRFAIVSRDRRMGTRPSPTAGDLEPMAVHSGARDGQWPLTWGLSTPVPEAFCGGRTGSGSGPDPQE